MPHVVSDVATACDDDDNGDTAAQRCEMSCERNPFLPTARAVSPVSGRLFAARQRVQFAVN